MASRADNIASNLSLANFSKATELKKRIWFTIGALIVFRFLTFVPLPGIDPLKLKQFLDRSAGGILDFFNMFSGGALSNYSLISLGVMPYITWCSWLHRCTHRSPTSRRKAKAGGASSTSIRVMARCS